MITDAVLVALLGCVNAYARERSRGKTEQEAYAVLFVWARFTIIVVIFIMVFDLVRMMY